MTIATQAKINLSLELLGRRPDGFHELATVFQAIDLADEIRLQPALALTVKVHGASVPGDERNLCWRAAALLATRSGRAPAVRIDLHKRVPVGGGLGGGSANAAGVLAALAQMWQLGLSMAELESLGAELGSDCAFFIRGGTALGGGRGEQLEYLPTPSLALVVVGPSRAVSTGAVYGQVRGFRADAGAASARLAEGLRAGAVPPTRDWLVNDLQAPATRVSPVLAAEQEVLAELCGDRFLLSGSGGSWFLVAGDPAEAADWAARLRARWPRRLVAESRPVDYGWRVIDPREESGDA